MANWKITLNGETKSTGTGNNITYTFPENAGTTPQVYTISYTSDTNYTVQTGETCQPCKCENINMSVNTIVLDYEGNPVDGSSINITTTCGEISFANVPDWITTSFTNNILSLTATTYD